MNDETSRPFPFDLLKSFQLDVCKGHLGRQDEQAEQVDEEAEDLDDAEEEKAFYQEGASQPTDMRRGAVVETAIRQPRSTVAGWWFGTCVFFPYIGNNNPN